MPGSRKTLRPCRTTGRLPVRRATRSSGWPIGVIRNEDGAIAVTVDTVTPAITVPFTVRITDDHCTEATTRLQDPDTATGFLDTDMPGMDTVTEVGIAGETGLPAISMR